MVLVSVTLFMTVRGGKRMLSESFLLGGFSASIDERNLSADVNFRTGCPLSLSLSLDLFVAS